MSTPSNFPICITLLHTSCAVMILNENTTSIAHASWIMGDRILNACPLCIIIIILHMGISSSLYGHARWDRACFVFCRKCGSLCLKTLLKKTWNILSWRCPRPVLLRSDAWKATIRVLSMGISKENLITADENRGKARDVGNDIVRKAILLVEVVPANAREATIERKRYPVGHSSC